jgi:hypothetical protein
VWLTSAPVNGARFDVAIAYGRGMNDPSSSGIWHRGIDVQGRLFTLAINPPWVSLFFPDIWDSVFTTASGGMRSSENGVPVRFWEDEMKLPEWEFRKLDLEIVNVVPSRALPGRYFPRMARGPEHPPVDPEARSATRRIARGLFRRLQDIFDVVEPKDVHAEVFGQELRQLLILACTEVESSWQAILRENNYGGDRWTTNDYVLLNRAMRLDEYTLTLGSHPSYGPITPFQAWTLDPPGPTKSLPWYAAYNATKHNRELNLTNATLAHAISAVAAVHVLEAAQFGLDSENDEWARSIDPEGIRFEKHPTWLEDAYIRPLPERVPAPDETTSPSMRPARWRSYAWVPWMFPFKS